MNPRLAGLIPKSFVELPKARLYVAATTYRSPDLDSQAECLADALQTILGAFAVEGFAATIVAAGQPDGVRRIVQERLGMKKLMMGHFAVRLADGTLDKSLLRQGGTLYATTNEPGMDGIDELRGRGNSLDFDDVLNRHKDS